MNPQRRTSSIRIFFLLVAALFVFAETPRANSTSARSQDKRQLDDRVPSHVPVKIKIKKEHEKGFQDLENELWIRDFHLEVTNTGDRPIYALSLVWTLQEVPMGDGYYGSTLLYGRGDFITDPAERPKPDDVSIQPGETHVYKLGLHNAEGWEGFAKEYGLPPPRSVMVFFNWLSFGDGTGWEGPNGKRFDRQKKASLSPALRKENTDYRANVRLKI